MKKWWMWPAFLVSFLFWASVLPFFPPMNALLQAVACDGDETYEFVQWDTGVESAAGFTCVKPDGSHIGYDANTPAAEGVAYAIDAAVSLVLGALPFAVMWWRRRR